MKKLLAALICLITLFATTSFAQRSPPRLPPPPQIGDDPNGRRCYELRREGICDEACGIKPPNCISGEEAGLRRMCAYEQVQGKLDEKCVAFFAAQRIEQCKVDFARGLVDQDCNATVLPIPEGAPHDGLSLAMKLNNGQFYWNAWSTCKNCYWTVDEVIINPENAYASFPHSSEATLKNYVNFFGQLNEKGWGNRLEGGDNQDKFIYFNPKLCKTAEIKSCYPVSNLILVADSPKNETRLYSSFVEFDKAEGNPFSCEINSRGEANCKFNIPPQ